MDSNVKKLMAKASDMVEFGDRYTEAEKTDVLEQIDRIIREDGGTPWWVVVLKVLAYAIGLILAGYGTTAAAATLMM